MSRSVQYDKWSDINWNVNENDDGKSVPIDEARLCVLMDIRRELKTLNLVFACHNFLEIPAVLRQIKKNTTKRKNKRKAAQP